MVTVTSAPKRRQKPEPKPSHHALGWLVVFPWAVCLILVGVVALYQLDIIDPDQNELDQFCEIAGRTPEQIMCSDMQQCDMNAVFLTAAASETNRAIDLFCPNAGSEVLMRVPYQVLAPDEQTKAEMMATVGAMDRWQRAELLKEVFEEKGGPDQ